MLLQAESTSRGATHAVKSVHGTPPASPSEGWLATASPSSLETDQCSATNTTLVLTTKDLWENWGHPNSCRREIRRPLERTNHRGGTHNAFSITGAGGVDVASIVACKCHEIADAVCLLSAATIRVTSSRVFQSRRNLCGSRPARKCARRRFQPGHEVSAAMDGGGLDRPGAMDGTGRTTDTKRTRKDTSLQRDG